MSANNPTLNSDWVRLNVGGKVFQTTKDTLSRYPDTFLSRLVNGDLPSAKDESGAYLIDADPEHFGTILNYLRRGSVTLDASKVILGDLLREADFFNIQPLVDEIRKQISEADKQIRDAKRVQSHNQDMTTRTMNDVGRISSKLSDIENKISRNYRILNPTFRAYRDISRNLE